MIEPYWLTRLILITLKKISLQIKRLNDSDHLMFFKVHSNIIFRCPVLSSIFSICHSKNVSKCHIRGATKVPRLQKLQYKNKHINGTQELMSILNIWLTVDCSKENKLYFLSYVGQMSVVQLLFDRKALNNLHKKNSKRKFWKERLAVPSHHCLLVRAY